MKTIGSKVEDELYDIFRLVCEKDGVTVSERVKNLVKEFVEKEAPFILLDLNVCRELKRIAQEKGLGWREMTCNAILNFCEKCSEEKEEGNEAPTEEEKSEEGSILQISRGKEEDKEAPIEEKLKTVKIVRE